MTCCRCRPNRYPSNTNKGADPSAARPSKQMNRGNGIPAEPAVKYVTARTPGMKRAPMTIFSPCRANRSST